MKNGKIGYIMSRFPQLSETFILREMVDMEQQGWEIALYPLVVQKQTVIHAAAKNFLSRVHKLPLLSATLLAANLQTLLKQPGRYLTLATRVIWENRTSLKFLIRALVVFPKSVQMAKLMQQEGVQHIHAHYATHPALAAWIIHHLTGIPYSITVHAHDIFVEKVMLATKLKDATFIVAISEFNRNYLASQVGEWVRQKTTVIHCGVLPENYSPHVEPATGSNFEIVSIGSLLPYKGQKYLVEACAVLNQSSIPIRCRIIGGGKLHPELAAQISASGLEDIVKLSGPRTQEEIAQLLPQADCYVQPSIITATGKMEGIPVSIMEAMACAVPVVATSISGVPELVQNQKTGLLVPPEDAGALAEAIAAIYNDPQNAKRMAHNGKELVLEQFSLHQNVQQLSLLMKSSIQAHYTQ